MRSDGWWGRAAMHASKLTVNSEWVRYPKNPAAFRPVATLLWSIGWRVVPYGPLVGAPTEERADAEQVNSIKKGGHIRSRLRDGVLAQGAHRPFFVEGRCDESKPNSCGAVGMSIAILAPSRPARTTVLDRVQVGANHDVRGVSPRP
jgi:hypothetical protein